MWIRIVMATTAIIGPILFFLAHTFPKKNIRLPFRYIVSLVLLMVTTVIFSLPPLVFHSIHYPGGEPTPIPGVGIPLFFVDFVGLIILSIIVLIRKYVKATGVEKRQFLLFLSGVFATFSLMAVTTVISVVIFKTSSTVFLGPIVPIFLMSFIAYGILHGNIFNTKVIATKLFVVIILIVLTAKVFFVESILGLLVDLFVLCNMVFFGNLLVTSVQREVREKEKTEKLASSLEAANLRLQEIDRQKTEFLSIASHQLRTPLSILKGYIELIQDGAYGKTTKKMLGVLDDMDQSNERLVKLVDEFLDITRIEQGRAKFVFEQKSINDLIADVVKELYQRAKDKGLEIVWKANAGITDICMDEEKVRHVIFNYIDNAIKYSETGKIQVSVAREDDGISVTVRDNGIGFEQEDQVNFFQKFYRGENVKGTNVNGTGLGIYVCRKFIEAHGGNVWAKSPGKGNGAEFGFWIPLKKDVEAHTGG